MGLYGGFLKVRGTLFGGVPIIRIIVFGGLCWGPLILGTYHLGVLSYRNRDIGRRRASGFRRVW